MLTRGEGARAWTGFESTTTTGCWVSFATKGAVVMLVEEEREPILVNEADEVEVDVAMVV